MKDGPRPVIGVEKGTQLEESRIAVGVLRPCHPRWVKNLLLGRPVHPTRKECSGGGALYRTSGPWEPGFV